MVDALLIFLGTVLLVLCWWQWRLMRAYCTMPSKRMEMEFLLWFFGGRYPNDTPMTSIAFQVLLKSLTEFQEQGLCVVWSIKPYVFVFSEEHMKNLINGVGLQEKASFYDIQRLIFGNGLITSKHDVWKVHRKLLNPGFNLPVLKSKMNSFNKYAAKLVEKLGKSVDKPVDDTLEALKYCAFQNMADIIFCLKLDNEKHVTLAEKIMKAVDSGSSKVIERYITPWLYWDFTLPLFKSGREYLRVARECSTLVRQLLQEIKKTAANKESQTSLESVKSCGNILLDLYLQDGIFTERDVLDHLINFASAGFDTTATAIMWCFYNLGHHPKEQEKAYNEIQSVVPDGEITYENLLKMKYLDCVVKETLRMYSTIPLIARQASQDLQTGQYTIPKGSNLVFFLTALHRDPKVFPEPEKFDPERFMDSTKLRTWMYVPFFEGHRNCIGKRFAMMEIKVNLAYVLRRFKITSLNNIYDSDLNWRVILYSLKPLKFSFENRHT